MNKSEIKQCQNCHQDFIIEPDDFQFYEKIKVPPPTFCPECRRQRRLAFLNIFNLYQRKCDLCKNSMISVFPEGSQLTVYCQQCWWSDKWNWEDYGKDYDFSRPFFEQWDALLHRVPLISLANDLLTNVNSEYNNLSGGLKNCYLLFHADFNEDCAYGFFLIKNKLLFDCSIAMLSDLSYDCKNIFKSSRCIGTRGNITESLNCIFLKDCSNCQDCFASANLRNKKYYIFNKPYTKEEYFKTIKQWDLGSYKTYKEVEKLAHEHWKKFPPQPVYDNFSVHCTGNYVFKSKNCKQCFEVDGAEDSKYLLMLYAPPIKDCYDVSSWGNNISLSYDSCNIGENSSNIKFCASSGINGYDLEYSKDSLSGSHNFGCISVKKGEYVILNKRYSKEQYEQLREKIIDHMNTMPYKDKQGNAYKYGEFFPVEISPFGYNESLSSNFLMLSEERATSMGYQWRKIDSKGHAITMKAQNIPDHINDAPDSILKEIASCLNCEKGFRIIQAELDFLRKMNLPLPRICPFCRVREKVENWVKSFDMVSRECGNCRTKFQTSYKKEIFPSILCKKCYLAEVA